MSLEIVYLLTVSLLLIIGLLYLWVRMRRRQGIPPLNIPNILPRASWAGGVFAKSVSVPIEAIRFPISALLIGSLLIVWMGQSIYQIMPVPDKQWVFALMLFGGIVFLLAGQTAVYQRVPRWIITPTKAINRYFNIESGQVALLVLAVPFALLARLAAGDVLLARNGFISILSWLLSIGFVVIGSLDLKDRRKVNINRPEIVYTAVLFCIALLLRGIATNMLPPTLSGDEGSAGLSALMFAKGKANNLFTVGWFSFPSMYFAVQSIGIHIWGQTVVALRNLSAFGGALAVVATYWMTRSLFDRKTAVLASAYLAASHYHMHFSRIGLNNIWDSLFGTIAILGFWYGWKSGRRIGYILCGVALGVGVYFYVSIRILPILFLFWAAMALWRQRAQFWHRLPSMILTVLIALIVILPLGLFFFNNPAEFNAPLGRVTILGTRLQVDMAYQDRTAVSILVEQTKLAVMGFTQEPLRLLYNPGAPLLLTGAATLFLIGVAWSITHFSLRYLLILLPLFGAIVSNIISQSPPASQRYVMAMPLVAVLMAIPLGQIGNWFDRMWPQVKNVGLIVTAVIMSAVITQDINYYFFEVYETYVLGGTNTLVATEVAYYLQEQTPANQTVYFFGFPRIGYYSFSTVPYLAPEMKGIDVSDPIQNRPAWELTEPTQFVFLPERLGELAYVREAFPEGRYQEFYAKEDLFLFAVYAINQ